MARYWKRHQALSMPRRGGRFTKRTLENSFGLHVDICAECRGFNVRSVGEDRALSCHHCGKPLRELAD